jgi:Protein of unknown function (DUF1203)
MIAHAQAFRITGLDAAPFQHLFGLPDEDLARHGVKRCAVTVSPGFPDRIEMRDAAVGETVLLVNYTHQPAATPYRASHAIFVREGATETYAAVNKIPDVLRRRILSLRGFDQSGMMIAADVTDGREIEPIILKLFAYPTIAYIHVHNAKQGCYAGRIDRAT